MYEVLQVQKSSKASQKKRLLFEGCCAKIHYCQADVRQNETLQNGRQIERFDRIKNESQKSFKKVLDNLSRK